MVKKQMIRLQKLQRSILTRDIQEFNAILLVLVAILLIGMSGLGSFAYFTSETFSTGKITGTVVKNQPTGVDTLIKQVGSGGLQKIVHQADSTLQIGNTSPVAEYRYSGRNGCNGVELDDMTCASLGGNYVSNASSGIEECVANDDSENYATADLNESRCNQYGGAYNPNAVKNYANFNNELWRIIGIFPTENRAGVIENRIKLIKNDFLTGQTSWGTRATSWETSGINEYLNGTYYDTLTDSAKEMIDEVKYYLGGYWTNVIRSDMYLYERKIDESDGGNYYYRSTFQNSLITKIGLLYTSDYGYACSECEAYKLFGYSNSLCVSNNWLFTGTKGEWLITEDSLTQQFAYSIQRNGNIKSVDSTKVFSKRPVLYLKPTVTIVDGDGTSTSPYIFE